MKVKLTRQGGAKFEAVDEDGHVAVIDGPPSVGGANDGIRPMQLVLMGLAGCSAVDVLHILHKGRHEVDDLEIEVEGTRADAVPAVFADVHLRFIASGAFDQGKLDRAVELSVTKYCSVARMLDQTVKFTWEAELRGPAQRT